MSLDHYEEEMIKIATPVALELVEQEAQASGEELTTREKTVQATQIVDQFIEQSDDVLNLPCDGPYCEICGMCAF